MASKTDTFKFKIVRKIAKISKRGTWNLELNEVQFGDGQPKLDLRVWNEDYTLMSKGLTLTEEEFEALKGIDASNKKKTRKKAFKNN